MIRSYLEFEVLFLDDSFVIKHEDSRCTGFNDSEESSGYKNPYDYGLAMHLCDRGTAFLHHTLQLLHSDEKRHDSGDLL
jgi:hypothetical protein